MKKCYADPTLQVSREDFERPKDLQIKVDCYGGIRKQKDSTAVEEQSTDEFEL